MANTHRFARRRAQAPGSRREVMLTQYDPLFSSTEIVRRLVLPLAVEQLREVAARRHETLAAYPLDLSKERFLIYLPSTAPPCGCGLLGPLEK